MANPVSVEEVRAASPKRWLQHWKLIVGCAFALQVQASAAAADPETDLDALVKAAQAEGDLVVYTAEPANVLQRVTDAFTKKYGIPAQFLRLSGVPLRQRYSTEAAAGNFAADIVLTASGAIPFAEEGIAAGWFQSLADANLPVIAGGEFPSRFNNDITAVVSIGPWVICYNTDVVKGDDIPADWSDLIDPKWKDQVILADPRTSDAYLDLWAMILSKYGEEYFDKLRAQNLRFYAGGPAAAQALAAGEGVVMAPTNVSSAQDVRAAGGPIDCVTPDYTTGVEMQVLLTATDKASNPNAARLFANYILSEEGNQVFNNVEDEGEVTMYDLTGLPKEYAAPTPDAIEAKDKLLGLIVGP